MKPVISSWRGTLAAGLAITAAGSWIALHEPLNAGEQPTDLRGLPLAEKTPAGPGPALLPQPGTYSADIPRPPYKVLVGPETLNPGQWPYPDEYDSAVAASEVHHVRYADGHIRLVEVAYFPHIHGQMHGHPYPSVFAVDAPGPISFNVRLDPKNSPKVSFGNAPKGRAFPQCATMGPQSPHAETNQDTWPHHFYRLEYLRVDGAELKEHWKEWYPHMLDPLLPVNPVKPAADAPKFSKAWPYPIEYDSVRAAPNNHKLLYEDQHIRLIEVTIRPGETESVHGHPYPSVFAYDRGPYTAADAEDHLLDPSSPLNGQDMSYAAAPPGFTAPTCSTMGPEAPHAVHNLSTVPIHFYRIEFKRIDGEGLKTHWREWYPWMATLTDEYAAHPYVLNY